MATIRIYDLKDNALAFDLRDIMRILIPRSLEARWKVYSIRSSNSEDEWFEATGIGGVRLRELAEATTEIPGADLYEIAKVTKQVIWGEFVGTLPLKSDETWLTVRAVDSTFYEITTVDDMVLNDIKSSFTDVRAVDEPLS